MIEIVPFKAEHAYAIDLQPGQQHWGALVKESGYCDFLEKRSRAYTALLDGKAIGCAGIFETGLGSGSLWAIAARDSGRHFVTLVRAVQRLITLVPLRRLEATVERGFTPGCRALELLGFTCEGLMKKYGPDGKDHLRYART